MINKRTLGSKYETLACDYLSKQGMVILDKNYRKRSGEIDIIAREEDTVVFCEVKYRSSNSAGNPIEAVDYRKQQQISKLALHYMMAKGYSQSTQFRFDVIGIYGNGEIVHIKNAFEYQYR